MSPDDSQEPSSDAESSELGPMEEARMGILEHLAELRLRILYSLGWLIVGFCVAWFWHEPLFEFLLQPLVEGASQLEVDASRDAVDKMHHKDLTEPIYVFLKISALGGVFLASPGILYNIWKFVAPGLYDRERKLAIPFVLAATLFFFGGAAFCYTIVLPFGYNFLLSFTGISDPQLMMSEYFSTTTKLLFGFGVIFELPVFSGFLAMLGIITHRTLLTYWRYAIVGSFLLAALLTPPDIITQAMMAGPLVILYGLSVGVAWMFAREPSEESG